MKSVGLLSSILPRVIDRSHLSPSREELLDDNPTLFIFNSPEPQAQVSYCHSAPSVIRLSSVPRRPSVIFYIFNFFSRTAWQILMKLSGDEVLMVPYKCCCFSARSPPGADPGRGQNRSRGSPSSRNFFFRLEGYSNKPNAKQWSNSMWEEVLFLLVPFGSQIFDAFLTSFWTLSFCLILMQFLWIFMR